MAGHPIINSDMLAKIFEQNKEHFQMLPLREYLKLGLKPRGTNSKTELNSHFETMITSEEIDPKRLADRQFALEKVGNKNQTVYATVQGYDPDKADSGFERPVVEEGPHMIIGVYAIDDSKHLHLFRTLQMRTNHLVVDTPRGFASTEMLDNGEQIYTANKDEVMANLARILKEEAGNLAIQDVQYLGDDIVNTSFVISKSACFAVRVDYSSFMSIHAILEADEIQRQLNQFQHEGIIGGIIDMTLDQYLTYRNDSSITHDMTADRISDLITMNYMRNLIYASQKSNETRTEEGNDDGDDIDDGNEDK